MMSVGAANLRWLSVAGTTGAQDRPKQVKTNGGGKVAANHGHLMGTSHAALLGVARWRLDTARRPRLTPGFCIYLKLEVK